MMFGQPGGRVPQQLPHPEVPAPANIRMLMSINSGRKWVYFVQVIRTNIGSRYGDGRIRFEWAYSIVTSVKEYAFMCDPDCQSLLSILNGEVPEAVYYATQKLLKRLRSALAHADKENHGGRMWGTLNRSEFSDTVESLFKFKTEEEKKALWRSLVQDLDHGVTDVRYKDLFEPPEGKPASIFMETLREQFIQEVQGAYEKVESSIRRATTEDAITKQSIRLVKPEESYAYLDVVKQGFSWLFASTQAVAMTDEQLLGMIEVRFNLKTKILL